MPDNASALTFEHSKSQSQFAYFLLGLAASAIAFAVHETSGKSLADTPWPLGAGVVLWGLSFVAGCIGLEARQLAMRSNVGFLHATRGLPAGIEEHPDLANVVNAVKKDARRTGDRFRLQLWLFFLGAVAYVAGHVMTMARTPPPSDAAAVSARNDKPSALPTASSATVPRH